MGETTTTLHEEMLATVLPRSVVDASLRGLVARGLMTTSRDTFAGKQHLRDGTVVDREYEDDWWALTDAGREAIGRPRAGAEAAHVRTIRSPANHRCSQQ
jgi:hypothetical protein